MAAICLACFAACLGWAIAGVAEGDDRRVLEQKVQSLVTDVQELGRICEDQKADLEHLLLTRDALLFQEVSSPDQRLRLLDLLSEDGLILHFYATYCIPCEQEYPHIDKYLESGKRTRKVVMVSQDLVEEQSFEDLRRHLSERLPKSIDQVLIVRDDCSFQRSIMGSSCEMPQTVLDSRDGLVTHREPGPSTTIWQPDFLPIQ